VTLSHSHFPSFQLNKEMQCAARGRHESVARGVARELRLGCQDVPLAGKRIGKQNMRFLSCMPGPWAVPARERVDQRRTVVPLRSVLEVGPWEAAVARPREEVAEEQSFRCWSRPSSWFSAREDVEAGGGLCFDQLLGDDNSSRALRALFIADIRCCDTTQTSFHPEPQPVARGATRPQHILYQSPETTLAGTRQLGEHRAFATPISTGIAGDTFNAE
jgi:hypothetical protein